MANDDKKVIKSLDEIPEVVLLEWGRGHSRKEYQPSGGVYDNVRFVVVNITSGKKKRSYLHANHRFKHYDVFWDFLNHNFGVREFCHDELSALERKLKIKVDSSTRGGKIKVVPERKIIYFYGESHDYGKFNVEQVQKMAERYVEAKLSGYKLIVE